MTKTNLYRRLYPVLFILIGIAMSFLLLDKLTTLKGDSLFDMEFTQIIGLLLKIEYDALSPNMGAIYSLAWMFTCILFLIFRSTWRIPRYYSSAGTDFDDGKDTLPSHYPTFPSTGTLLLLIIPTIIYYCLGDHVAFLDVYDLVIWYVGVFIFETIAWWKIFKAGYILGYQYDTNGSPAFFKIYERGKTISFSEEIIYFFKTRGIFLAVMMVLVVLANIFEFDKTFSDYVYYVTQFVYFVLYIICLRILYPILKKLNSIMRALGFGR